MTPALAMILVVSFIGAAIGIAALESAGRRPLRLALSAALVAGAAAVYSSALSRDTESKGAVQETVAVAFCYLSMLVGMVAQYCYRQAEAGAKKLRFKPMEFMMPIFASPIVFIPLLTISSDISMGGAFTKAKLMVYLVAFQNGFFWKSFFEQRRQGAEAAAPAQAVLVQ
jgi:hypothetical protein